MTEQETDRLLAEYAAARRAVAEQQNRANQLEARLEDIRRLRRYERRPWTGRRSRDDEAEAVQVELEAAREQTAGWADAAARTKEELRERWLDDGRSPAELTKLLRKTDYSETVETLFSGRPMIVGSGQYEAAVRVQKSIANELRSFWVTSGHDLSELREFMSSVDVHVQAIVPR